ncbi:MAG: T9SS type A sorting domain-containing protein [Bacteroidetes bacterium]|nr:T9SS type A sorting domain-containing protein [Bacteroidota bacterium]
MKSKSLQITLISTFLILLTFTSSAQFTCGDNIVDVRDGRVYKTVLIGSQCWMAENLNYGTMINSNTTGNQMSNNGIIEKYCWDNDSNNCDGTNGKEKLGGFYEWGEAVKNYSGQPSLPVQGVCPSGWHIPTRAEYIALTTQLGGSSVAGGKMKVSGSSGFDGILTGYRCTMTGGFRKSAGGATWSAYFWVSEQSDATNAYFYELTEDNNSFAPCAYSPFAKALGNCIRCIQDGSVGTSELNRIHNNFEISFINVEENYMKININSTYTGFIKLDLVDVTGRYLKTENIEIVQGENSSKIDIGNLATGLYIVKFQNGNTAVSQKVFIP